MGTVWEYQYEYTELDSGDVKLYPFWLTEAEAGCCHTLLENDFGRKRARRERVGEPEWRAVREVKPCGIKPLPEFETPLHRELIELYRRERDPDVRRVILEVVRVRRVLGEIEHLVATIRQEYGDGLVAMYSLRCLVKGERERVGEFGGPYDKAWRAAGACEESGRPDDAGKAK